MKLISILFFLGILSGCSREEFSPVSNEDINFDEPITFSVESPSEGAKFYAGEYCEIRWKSGANQASVDIYIIKKKSYYKKYISNGTANDGYFEWKIPRDIVPSHHYQIVVANSNLPQFESYSKVFSILNQYQ